MADPARAKAPAARQPLLSDGEQTSRQRVSGGNGIQAENGDESAGGVERRRQSPLQLRRRIKKTIETLRDGRFMAAEIEGLTSREFEVDLMQGEKIQCGPIRIKLTKTESRWHRSLWTIVTLGLYQVWRRYFASGSQVFDVEARIAITSRGRLLLWTHRAAGGGMPFLKHCARAAARPVSFLVAVSFVLFFVFGPVFLGQEVLNVAIVLFLLAGLALISVVWNWFFERSSLMAYTSVRQFDARELSCVRLLCYSQTSFCGWGGETTAVRVHLFFGMYPKQTDLLPTLPHVAFDTGSVLPSAAAMKDQASGNLNAKIQQAAGQSFGGESGERGFPQYAASVLIFLAFAAFLNEMYDFFSALSKCLGPGAADTLDGISQCISTKFKDWWTGQHGAAPQTVISHWIDAMDWSLQLTLFFYVVGPAAALLWSTMTDRGDAGLGFIVDRRGGMSTEDESFEDHWEELTVFVQELYMRACDQAAPNIDHLLSGVPEPPWNAVSGDVHFGEEADHPERPSTAGAGAAMRPSTASAAPRRSFESCVETMEQGGAPRRSRASVRPGREWVRTAGNKKHRASWGQVEELMSTLIDPLSGKVNVYRDVLSLLDGERVMAVYPEKVIMGLVTRIKIVLTCGLEYFCHWRRRRRDGAIILTDRRLIQISAMFSPYQKSLKVDMFTIAASVKYLALDPPRPLCCQRPKAEILMATRCGLLHVTLRRTKRLQDRARLLWQGLALLQDCDPIRVQEGAWESCSEDEEDFQDGSSVNAFQSFLEPEAEEAVYEARDVWSSLVPEVGRAPEDNATSRAPTASESPLGTQGRVELWGLTLSEDERILWGPQVFQREVFTRCRFQGRDLNNATRLAHPSALVALTDRRLVVIQYRSIGPLNCKGVLHRVYVDSIAIVPLQFVLGFVIQEELAMQQAMLMRLAGRLCCKPLTESVLAIKILTNAGLGKVYLGSLQVNQRRLPWSKDAACTFEESKILELRRWLGNIASFNTERAAAFFRGAGAEPPEPVEIFKGPRGWAPW
eukprot:TRINITY_DN122397_c0_g1_i1.p1 TRINITY_DN122397_c0_g1~~TRINITY_DN122397_c0_g1_i1.p1  ORF type:complete len:1020 (+),score=223.68 TRINITY_DN122397_c0_g1_i1:68-3127(+)